MFKMLGILVAAYTLYAVIRGEVLAKSGPWGRVVSKETSPHYFWIVIVVYAGLAAALFTVF
jgi:hypothetical protein